jgi:trk system potassium uptake protein TrkA
LLALVLELVAHGDSQSSRVVGKRIEAIDLPKGATIGALVRGDEVIMAHHDEMIEAEDHVILFVADKSKIPDVERLFQVGITFF